MLSVPQIIALPRENYIFSPIVSRFLAGVRDMAISAMEVSAKTSLDVEVLTESIIT